MLEFAVQANTLWLFIVFAKLSHFLASARDAKKINIEVQPPPQHLRRMPRHPPRAVQYLVPTLGALAKENLYAKGALKKSP